MLAAAEFSDWNPGHFLDVGEMTAALAIGYDWLYKELDPAARLTIKEAIIEKGLNPSLKGGWWVTAGPACFSTIRIVAPAHVSLELFETAQPPAEYDAPNKGSRMIGFNAGLPAATKSTFSVLLTPGKPGGKEPVILPIAHW